MQEVPPSRTAQDLKVCPHPWGSLVATRGGLLREEPSQTSKPWSHAANAWLPVTPLDTQVRDVSRMPKETGSARVLVRAWNAQAGAAMAGQSMAAWPPPPNRAIPNPNKALRQ